MDDKKREQPSYWCARVSLKTDAVEITYCLNECSLNVVVNSKLNAKIPNTTY